jgi:hypothetical protein
MMRHAHGSITPAALYGDTMHMQVGWTADDEAVLQQLRPSSNDGSTAQYPPLLLIANKCDLGVPSSHSDPATADGTPGHGVPPAVDASTNGAGPQDSRAAPCDAVSHAASPVAAAMPAALRSAASAVVHTSAKTGEGLEALKQAVLTLTDTPQLATGAPLCNSEGAPELLDGRQRSCNAAAYMWKCA